MGPRSNSAALARSQESKPLEPKLTLAALAAAIVLIGGSIAWRVAHSPAATPSNCPEGMVWVPGGRFLMGSDHKLAQDNERPAHRVRVDGFWMDRHHVTNAEFRKFVEATGYVTIAEKKPDWETMKVQTPPGTPKPPARPGTGGRSILSVDGNKVAEGKIPKTQPFAFSADEGVDVGLDGETNVSNDYKQVGNAFTGRIIRVKVDAGAGDKAAASKAKKP